MKLKDILDEFDSATESTQRDPVQKIDTLGPFTLEEKIGEGTFGTVWRAHQSVPVQREVALKILKIGMDTGEVLARFEQERQTLALMDHPNIARVFDAGASEAGRPYFVMELVHARESLTRYCQERSLPLERRIQLFREACLAIQHAHQKGIIHRDIKPSNILVSSEDPPRVKVIDFGIAKVITSDGSPDQTFRTRADRFMGTPAYMSPEQLADARDVDTRSDVYSLGVILYELLTDTLPFDAETAHARERSTVTKKPSQQSTRETKSELRGDLDCITLKCLEVDRQRRYQSPSDLVADLDRYLTHQPILARPPEGLYLASQFYKRHKAAAAPAGLNRSDIPAELVEAEKEVFRKQMENSGKPDNIIDKII
ncbi:hypothetical protein GCM10007100_28760 [Roseibacillus persicicus]|uniref:Protein kinase domain-containing protein n=1 Tax=Roseibacillus persicicus TaxID=454148 RepID=A0A918WMG8_9BACT|nr:hypothetical protein GCM10007100_28760 [Roseibacillus persicicus]